MFVGGEFYDDPQWLLEHLGLSTNGMTFLNGGKVCLMVIADYLLDHGVREVLLPSYLCPSIVDTLEQCGMACVYYQVLPDFSIDLSDMARKAKTGQAVYFINYFGFPHSEQVRAFLLNVQQEGMLLIEDNAQAGFTAQPIGDFVFNSLRKLAPYDGGYLATSLDVQPYVSAYSGTPNRRLPLIRDYRKRLVSYLFRGEDSYEALAELYRQAEAYYDSDAVVLGDAEERRQIERLNWPEIRRRRRENYIYMLELIRDLPAIQPVFPHLPDEVVPLGLPVYMNQGSRDALHDWLGEAGIGLTVHWHEILSDSRLNGNPTAVEIAAKIITLCIDQRTSHKQMDFQEQMIREWVKQSSQRMISI